jgi:hypothetical protein
MKKILFFLTLCIASCNSHSEDNDSGIYDATILINQPLKNANFLVDAFVKVDISFERPNNGIIHNIDVAILDSSQAVVTILKQGHVHTKSPYRFENQDFKARAKGKFFVRAKTTDDDDKNPIEVNHPFFIQ